MGYHDRTNSSNGRAAWCSPCARKFRNENDLRAHERSALHAGRSILCHRKGCTGAFVSPAGLAIHLESGACASGATRHTVDKFFVARDPNRIITDLPANLNTSKNTTSSKKMPQPEVTCNGHAYKCSHPQCDRTFGSLRAAEQHLESPAHAQKRYICAEAAGGCGKTFGTLSALLQHWESKSAACGVRGTFVRLVQRILGDLAGSGKVEV